MADRFSQRHRTDTGFVIERYVLAGTKVVTRRDDLRGVWQVDGGGIHASREEAFAEADRLLDAEPEETPEP